jgi:hypothetical protein
MHKLKERKKEKIILKERKNLFESLMPPIIIIKKRVNKDYLGV